RSDSRWSSSPRFKSNGVPEFSFIAAVHLGNKLARGSLPDPQVRTNVQTPLKPQPVNLQIKEIVAGLPSCLPSVGVGCSGGDPHEVSSEFDAIPVIMPEELNPRIVLKKVLKLLTFS